MEEPSESRQQLEQEQALQVGPRDHPRGRRPEQPDGRLVPGARQVGGSLVGRTGSASACHDFERGPGGRVRFAYQIRLSILHLRQPPLPFFPSHFYKWPSYSYSTLKWPETLSP